MTSCSSCAACDCCTNSRCAARSPPSPRPSRTARRRSPSSSPQLEKDAGVRAPRAGRSPRASHRARRGARRRTPLALSSSTSRSAASSSRCRPGIAPVRVAVLQTAAQAILPDALALLAEREPTLRVEIAEVPPEDGLFELSARGLRPRHRRAVPRAHPRRIAAACSARRSAATPIRLALPPHDPGDRPHRAARSPVGDGAGGHSGTAVGRAAVPRRRVRTRRALRTRRPHGSGAPHRGRGERSGCCPISSGRMSSRPCRLVELPDAPPARSSPRPADRRPHGPGSGLCARHWQTRSQRDRVWPGRARTEPDSGPVGRSCCDPGSFRRRSRGRPSPWCAGSGRPAARHPLASAWCRSRPARRPPSCAAVSFTTGSPTAVLRRVMGGASAVEASVVVGAVT